MIPWRGFSWGLPGYPARRRVHWQPVGPFDAQEELQQSGAVGQPLTLFTAQFPEHNVLLIPAQRLDYNSSQEVKMIC